MWREGVGAVRRRVGYGPGGVGWPRNVGENQLGLCRRSRHFARSSRSSTDTPFPSRTTSGIGTTRSVRGRYSSPRPHPVRPASRVRPRGTHRNHPPPRLARPHLRVSHCRGERRASASWILANAHCPLGRAAALARHYSSLGKSRLHCRWTTARLPGSRPPADCCVAAQQQRETTNRCRSRGQWALARIQQAPVPPFACDEGGRALRARFVAGEQEVGPPHRKRVVRRAR
jgi:hypothetical protein